MGLKREEREEDDGGKGGSHPDGFAERLRDEGLMSSECRGFRTGHFTTEAETGRSTESESELRLRVSVVNPAFFDVAAAVADAPRCVPLCLGGEIPGPSMKLPAAPSGSSPLFVTRVTGARDGQGVSRVRGRRLLVEATAGGQLEAGGQR
jgi:hypothetical protein